MHRQLKAGRRVCRRELLEASAQPTAFSSDERELQPLLSGALPPLEELSTLETQGPRVQHSEGQDTQPIDQTAR